MGEGVERDGGISPKTRHFGPGIVIFWHTGPSRVVRAEPILPLGIQSCRWEANSALGIQSCRWGATDRAGKPLTALGSH